MSEVMIRHKLRNEMRPFFGRYGPISERVGHFETIGMGTYMTQHVLDCPSPMQSNRDVKSVHVKRLEM